MSSFLPHLCDIAKEIHKEKTPSWAQCSISVISVKFNN